MINQHFRHHFPFFHDNSWTYLDSAATTLKPQVLLDSTEEFYRSAGSVHRSLHDLAQTEAYERARDLVQAKFNVSCREAVIWTSGTTHAINLVAQGLADQIKAGDEIVISIAEHHANFLPWQQLAQRKGAKLIILPLNEHYQICPSHLEQVLSPRTKVVAFNLISNVTGVRQPAEILIPLIRQASNALILLDIAQAACTEKIDIQRLDADFYAFSAHKMYGPTGVGCLLGKPQLLQQLQPLFFGGKMLENVTTESVTLAALPYRLEAGTPNVAGIIGFGKVLEWLAEWDWAALNLNLQVLSTQAYERLSEFGSVERFSPPSSSIVSFHFNDCHYSDLAAILTEQQIAIRSGEHCARPYLRYLERQGTLRISLAHYNCQADLDHFFEGLAQARALLAD